MTEPNVTGQIIFRGASGELRNRDWSQPKPNDPWTYSMGVGLVHLQPGALPVERTLGVILDQRRDGRRLHLSRSGQPDPEFREDLGHLDIGGILTTMDVASPGGFANLLAHGGVFLRRTRFPGPEGTETCLAVAIMRTGPDQLPERTMFRLSGTPTDLALTDPRPMPDMFPPGCAASHAPQQPVWEARDGLRSLRSTLRLDVIDDCNEAIALDKRANRTPEEDARHAQLMRGYAGSVLSIKSRDPEFRGFVEMGRQMGVDLERPFDSYPTAAENDAQEKAVERVMRAYVAQGPTFGLR